MKGKCNVLKIMKDLKEFSLAWSLHAFIKECLVKATAPIVLLALPTLEHPNKQNSLLLKVSFALEDRQV